MSSRSEFVVIAVCAVAVGLIGRWLTKPSWKDGDKGSFLLGLFFQLLAIVVAIIMFYMMAKGTPTPLPAPKR